MTSLFQAMALFLPVRIERVFWDGDTLMLFSKDWTFRTESVWRVSKDEDLLFTCWDDCASELISIFSDQCIQVFSWLADGHPIDPCFKFSNGVVLSVFCSLSTDPWVMEFADGAVYVGNT